MAPDDRPGMAAVPVAGVGAPESAWRPRGVITPIALLRTTRRRPLSSRILPSMRSSAPNSVGLPASASFSSNLRSARLSRSTRPTADLAPASALPQTER